MEPKSSALAFRRTMRAHAMRKTATLHGPCSAADQPAHPCAGVRASDDTFTRRLRHRAHPPPPPPTASAPAPDRPRPCPSANSLAVDPHLHATENAGTFSANRDGRAAGRGPDGSSNDLGTRRRRVARQKARERFLRTRRRRARRGRRLRMVEQRVAAAGLRPPPGLTTQTAIPHHDRMHRVVVP